MTTHFHICMHTNITVMCLHLNVAVHVYVFSLYFKQMLPLCADNKATQCISKHILLD